MNQPRFYILFLLLVALSAVGPTVAWAADDSSASNLAPELQIKIGDFGQASDFQVGYGEGSCPPEKSQYGKCLEVPWISQYIGAIYRYGVALAAALAMLMITIGGAVWLTAGGSSERVSTAKSLIVSAISGLMLALLSYVILYTVNPQLVALESLSVPVVSDQPEPAMPQDSNQPTNPGCCLARRVQPVDSEGQPTPGQTVLNYSWCFPRNDLTGCQGQRDGYELMAYPDKSCNEISECNEIVQ